MKKNNFKTIAFRNAQKSFNLPDNPQDFEALLQALLMQAGNLAVANYLVEIAEYIKRNPNPEQISVLIKKLPEIALFMVNKPIRDRVQVDVSELGPGILSRICGILGIDQAEYQGGLSVTLPAASPEKFHQQGEILKLYCKFISTVIDIILENQGVGHIPVLINIIPSVMFLARRMISARELLVKIFYAVEKIGARGVAKQVLDILEKNFPIFLDLNELQSSKLVSKLLITKGDQADFIRYTGILKNHIVYRQTNQLIGGLASLVLAYGDEFCVDGVVSLMGLFIERGHIDPSLVCVMAELIEEKGKPEHLKYLINALPILAEYLGSDEDASTAFRVIAKAIRKHGTVHHLDELRKILPMLKEADISGDAVLFLINITTN